MNKLANYLIKKAWAGYGPADAGGIGPMPSRRGNTPYDTNRISQTRQQGNKGVTDYQEGKYQADNLENTKEGLFWLPTIVGGIGGAYAGVRGAARVAPKVWNGVRGAVKDGLNTSWKFDVAEAATGAGEAAAKQL